MSTDTFTLRPADAGPENLIGNMVWLDHAGNPVITELTHRDAAFISACQDAEDSQSGLPAAA